MSAVDQILAFIRDNANKKNCEGMKRYAINTDNAYGVPVPVLRKYARQFGKNHQLALDLWDTKVHEARLIASLLADPEKLNAATMDKWAGEFDSWDICDQCCNNLFERSRHCLDKIYEWTNSDKQFVKRAGFVLMASLSVHNKKLDDPFFLGLLPIIIQNANDERNFVKKAVNWALRQIGKRNLNLHQQVLMIAEKLSTSENKTTRWIGVDAIKDITSASAQRRLIKTLKN